MGFKTYATDAGMPGPTMSSPGGAAQVGPGGWHPTVLYMLALVIVEILVVGFLSRHLFGGGE